VYYNVFPLVFGVFLQPYYCKNATMVRLLLL
jgi:hypothetical protein